MSGDDIKERLEDAIDDVCYDCYGCSFHELSAEDKLTVLIKLATAIKYLGGDW